MRWPLVRLLLSRELLSAVRDRRTLVSTILMPLLLIPLFVVGFPLLLGRAFSGQGAERQRVGVVGPLPAALRERLTADRRGDLGVVLVPVGDALGAVRGGSVEAALSLPAGLPTRAGTGGGTVRLYGRLGNLKAESGVLDKLRTRLTAYNDALVIRELGRRGLDPGFLTPIRVRTVDASRPQEAASGQLAFIIPLFLLQFILAGAVGPAIDSTAGEKERGTLEALLVSPARRVEVVAAKLLATTISALTAAGCGLIGLLLSGALARRLAGSGPAGGLGGQLSVSPAAFLVLGLMVLSAALLLSALLISVSIFARSAREAQTYVAPISLLIVLPAVGLQFADFIGRGAALYAVPLVNAMLTILDIVKGALSLPHALLALGVNLLCTGLLGLLALRSFGREGVIFRS